MMSHFRTLFVSFRGQKSKGIWHRGFVTTLYFAQTVTKSRFAFSVLEFPDPEELTHKDLADAKLSPLITSHSHKN